MMPGIKMLAFSINSSHSTIEWLAQAARNEVKKAGNFHTTRRTATLYCSVKASDRLLMIYDYTPLLIMLQKFTYFFL